jgi:hypothetical protein
MLLKATEGLMIQYKLPSLPQNLVSSFGKQSLSYLIGNTTRKHLLKKALREAYV